MDINQAEVLAIHRALKISSIGERIGRMPIIVESDSKNAVEWCCGKAEGPWNLTFIINFIKNAATFEPRVTITYRGRSSNAVADSLAKLGLRRADEFVAWI